MGIQFCFSSKPIMKSLLLVALLSPPLLWLSLRPMLPLMPGMDIMDIPAITDTAVTDTMVDTMVWDTADTTADTGRGKPRLRPNPLPPLGRPRCRCLLRILRIRPSLWILRWILRIRFGILRPLRQILEEGSRG